MRPPGWPPEHRPLSRRRRRGGAGVMATVGPKLVVRGGTVVTMNDTQDILPATDVVIRGNRIAALLPSGCGGYEDAGAEAEVIDARGMFVLPGLASTHTHLAMTILRGYAEGVPLQEWLEQWMWPAEAFLAEEDVYWGTLLALAEMIRSGITFCADMYFFADSVARAVEESGVRALLARGLLARIWDRAVDEAIRLHREWNGKGGGRIRVAIAPHALYTCPPAYLEKAVRLAGELGAPLHIHLSETRREVRETVRQFGLRPVEVAERTGAFDRPVIAAHCVHVSPGEIEILRRHRVLVSHSPVSNARLGSGVAPLREFARAGVSFSLGTDGAASCGALDMFELMRTASYLQMATHRDPAFPDPGLILSAAVGGVSYIFPDAGRIAEGALADLITVDAAGCHLTPVWNTCSSLVYSARGADVRTVIVDGRVLMKDRRLATIDEDVARAEVMARAQTLAHKVGKGCCGRPRPVVPRRPCGGRA